MSVEVPSKEELLSFVPVAHYNDKDYGTRGPLSDGRGGARHLSSVLPALSSALGCPVTTRIHQEPQQLQQLLHLPDASSAIVVLVDGLGFWNIQSRLGHAPYLRSMMNEPVNCKPIATCAPSTTVAALATFGTGTCPGLTAMTGYTQLNPETGELAQLIQFKNSIDPLELQRQPTVFELLAQRGIRVTSVGLPKFAGSALTMAALRGSEYVSRTYSSDLVKAACRAAQTPGLTYLYLRDADKIGHNYGWFSERWVAAFEGIDESLGQLRRNAPQGTLIVIVADHGMLSASAEERTDVAQVPELAQGVQVMGGEPRSVMLYAQDGENPEDIAARWAEYFGDGARIRIRDEAIREGIFGEVDQRVMPMIGDVLVAMGGNATVVDSRIQTDKATRLPSVHGSQSMIETDIPMIIDMA